MNELEKNFLEHHGIKGMRWGVRRYQNPDGSLTEAGKKRATRDAYTENKWSTSANQPSSVRSSIAAGIYAAHPTEKNAKKLDKLNEADANRYKAAKEAAKTTKTRRQKLIDANSENYQKRYNISKEDADREAVKRIADSKKWVENYVGIAAGTYLGLKKAHELTGKRFANDYMTEPLIALWAADLYLLDKMGKENRYMTETYGKKSKKDNKKTDPDGNTWKSPNGFTEEHKQKMREYKKSRKVNK